MLSIGFYMKNTSYNAQIYQLHKTLGVLFCLLVVFRLVWRNKNPWQSSSLGTTQEKLVHNVHLTLIALMVLMPITGFMVSAFSGFGIHINGFYIVPELFNDAGEITPLHDRTYQAAKLLHKAFAYCFSILISGHSLAAVRHYFITTDKKNTKMNPFEH